MTDSREVPSRRPGWVLALAAAAAVLVAGLGGWFLVARSGSEPPVITGPPASTSTTGVSSTTTTLAGWGLDALAVFQAGPVPPPATCPVGSTPDVAGDPAAPRPVPSEPFSHAFYALDRQSGLLVAVIEPRGESEPGVYETWTFDVCRNRWQEVASAGLDAGGLLSGLIYDIDSDLTVGVDEVGTVWAFDADSGAWAARPWAAGKPALPNHWPAIYDSASGLIVLYDSGPDAAPWAYDVDTDARYALGPWGEVLLGRFYQVPSMEPFRDPTTEHFFYFTEDDLQARRWEFGAGWVEAGTPAPSALKASPACNADPYWGLLATNTLAFDEATGRFVFFCAGTAAAAFDPAAAAWELLGALDSPAMPLYSPAAFYDTANARLLLVGPGGEVWAYDGPAGAFTELLAASE